MTASLNSQAVKEVADFALRYYQLEPCPARDMTVTDVLLTATLWERLHVYGVKITGPETKLSAFFNAFAQYKQGKDDELSKNPVG